MIECPWQCLEKIPELGQTLSCLKGIGPKRSRLLAKRGLHTVLDLLYFFPVQYEDRTRSLDIGRAEDRDQAWVSGTVVNARENLFPGSRKRLFRVVIEDDTGRIDLVWFHYRKPHLLTVAA